MEVLHSGMTTKQPQKCWMLSRASSGIFKEQAERPALNGYYNVDVESYLQKHTLQLE